MMLAQYKTSGRTVFFDSPFHRSAYMESVGRPRIAASPLVGPGEQ